MLYYLDPDVAEGFTRRGHHLRRRDGVHGSPTPPWDEAHTIAHARPPESIAHYEDMTPYLTCPTGRGGSVATREGLRAR